MQTLGDYFLYEKDEKDIKNIFENLSRQLKIIHGHGMVVPNLSSTSVVIEDNTFSFKDMIKIEESEFDKEKRKNIVSLGKVILGAFLSLPNEYRDFSKVEDEWFKENINGINSAIISEEFDGEYYSLIFNGSNEYYSDYLDRKKQEENISGRENVSRYAKVLKTAASSLYEDQSEEDYSNVDNKTASVRTYFYPILIGVSILLTVSLSIFINVFNK